MTADEAVRTYPGGAGPTPAPRPSRLRRAVASRYFPWFTTPALIVLFGVAWKLYVEIFDVSKLVLPAPEQVAVALKEQLGRRSVWSDHIWTTTYETLIGFGLALVVGVVLGVVIARWQLVETVFNPFIIATQVVPKVALVPLFILWFGFGPTSKIAVATMLAFFPIMTNTSFGIKSIPQDMRDLFHVTRFRSFSRFWRLELPYATPYVLAGAEVGIVLATIGAIVGEYLSGDRGLGRYAVALQNSLLIPELYASIIMMTALGFLFYVSVMAIRRLLIPWHESVKGSTNQVS